MQPRNKLNISKEEKDSIHNEHILDPLPEGFFFNGFGYVDPFGDVQERHPEFETFLQGFVDRENGKIQEANEARVQMWGKLEPLTIDAVREFSS